jgi:hypothetical protein
LQVSVRATPIPDIKQVDRRKKCAKDSLFLLNWQATATTGHVDALRDQLKVLEKVSKDAVVSRRYIATAEMSCCAATKGCLWSALRSGTTCMCQNHLLTLLILQWFTVKEGPNGMQQVLMVTNDAKKVCAGPAKGVGGIAATAHGQQRPSLDGPTTAAGHFNAKALPIS